MKKIITLGVLLTAGQSLYAQGIIVNADALNAPSYIIVVLSGVLLAFGFQFLLTALSVAAGVTAIGDLKEAYVENKYKDDHYGKQEDDSDDEDEDGYEIDPDTPLGVKVSSGIGVWNVLTVGISLFAATYLALQMIPITTEITKITLSLVIWAMFFMLMFYLESRMVGTLLGSLISTAIAGLKASASAVTNFFKPTSKTDLKQVVDHTVEKLRSEIGAEFDTESILNAVRKFADKVSKDIPSYKTLKKDLKEIAKSTGSKSRGSAAKWMALQTAINAAVQAAGNTDTEEGKQKVNELKRLLADAKEAYEQGDNTQEGIINVLKMTPADEQKVNEQINAIKNKMKNSSIGDMETSELKRTFDEFVNDPQGKAEHLVSKFKELDRQTIVETLNENTALDKTQLETYADRIEQTMHHISERLSITNNDPNIDNLIAAFEKKLKQFINTTDAEELQYSFLKNDVKRAINDPKQSLSIIKNRLDTFDKNTLTAVLTNTPWIEKRHINKLADTIEDAKEEVNLQIQKINDKAISTKYKIERKAVIHADRLRKTAVAASWWLVATIVTSAGAAIAGATLVV